MWSDDEIYNIMINFLINIYVYSFILLIIIGSLNIISIKIISNISFCILIFFLIICVYDEIEHYIFLKIKKLNK